MLSGKIVILKSRCSAGAITRFYAFWLILCFFPASFLFPEEKKAIFPALLIEYPLIQRLGPKDIVFVQLQDSLAQSYAAENGSREYPDLYFCRWVAAGGEDFFDVAARLNIPYDTLASLNAYEHNKTFKKGEELVIPSQTGIFIVEEPRIELDFLLAAREIPEKVQKVSVKKGGSVFNMVFVPGSRFYPTERSFFLLAGFRLPLAGGLLTSRYGMRKSPIDGYHRMHNGVDLAAPKGSSVLASREGLVSKISSDSVLGLYIVLDHGSGLSSMYGHLDSVLVELNQKVNSGNIIATVGSSGLSTGSHLHFEIRLDGSARDPSTYIPGLRK
ncbi:M23 family metallopeptidase [Spirochaetota bacterium]